MLSAVGITALVYTIIEAPNWGWTSTRASGGFIAAAIVLVGFALWERRSSHPMLTYRCSPTAGSPVAAWR